MRKVIIAHRSGLIFIGICCLALVIAFGIAELSARRSIARDNAIKNKTASPKILNAWGDLHGYAKCPRCGDSWYWKEMHWVLVKTRQLNEALAAGYKPGPPPSVETPDPAPEMITDNRIRFERVKQKELKPGDLYIYNFPTWPKGRMTCDCGPIGTFSGLRECTCGLPSTLDVYFSTLFTKVVSPHLKDEIAYRVTLQR